MINHDQELRVTQQQIAYVQGLLTQLRVSARPEEFPAVAGGYRAEIERLQAALNSRLSPLDSQLSPLASSYC